MVLILKSTGIALYANIAIRFVATLSVVEHRGAPADNFDKPPPRHPVIGMCRVRRLKFLSLHNGFADVPDHLLKQIALRSLGHNPDQGLGT